MTRSGDDSNSEELQFLFSRHDRIVDSSMEINKILHTTFYLSAVVIAGIAGVVPQFNHLLSRVVLYITGFFLFVAMLGFTRTYLTSRRTLADEMSTVVEEIAEVNHDMETISPENFVSKVEDYNQDGWERSKDDVLQLYYLTVSLSFAAILLTDIFIHI